MFNKPPIGIGYIICPPNVNSVDYIETCYKTETVSIITEDFGIYHNVRVARGLMEMIDFPNVNRRNAFNEIEINGSGILYVITRRSQSIPVIIAVFSNSDDISSVLPGQWSTVVNRQEGQTNASVSGDSMRGHVNVTTHAKNSKGQDIIVRATSDNKKASVDIESDDRIDIAADKDVQIHAKQSIKLGNDNFESGVLGDTLVGLMEDLIEAINKITVPTAYGPSGTPINAAEFTTIKDRLSDMLSKLNSLE